MRDFVFVNITNEGRIPWLMKNGPLFYEKLATGVYLILKRDPRVNIAVTDYETAMNLKSDYLKKKNKESKKEIPEEIVEKNVPEINILDKEIIQDENDDAIDAILETETVEMMVSDIANAPEQKLDADGMIVYSDEEISKMTKKQLKEVLENRGHAAGQRFVKTDDPFSPMYHDSVDELREKVKSSQQTF